MPAAGSHEVEEMYHFPLSSTSALSEYVVCVGVTAFFHSASKVCRVVKSAAGSVFVTQPV